MKLYYGYKVRRSTTTTTCPHCCFCNAACCNVSVVETAGHPFPVPLRFCSVTSAVSMRASCDATELSSGKDTLTVGLFTAWPAVTSARRCYTHVQRLKVSFSDGIPQSATLTWLNVAWSGGQLHGTWIGLPSPPFIAPSQLPVPEYRSLFGEQKCSTRTEGD